MSLSLDLLIMFKTMKILFAGTGWAMNPETILVAKVVFWVSLGLVVYPYVLYPLVLFFAYSATQAWRDLRYLGSPRNQRTETPAPCGSYPV